MAVSFVGVGAKSEGNNVSSFVVVLPTHQTGDLLLLLASQSEGGSPGISFPGDWSTALTRVTSADPAMLLGYKIAASSSETNPTVSFVPTGPSNELGQACAFRGMAASSPLDTVSTVSSWSSTTHIGPISGFTPNAAAGGGVVVVCGARSEDWVSVDTLSGDGLTWVEIGEPDTSLGFDTGMVWDYAILPETPPTITTKTFNVVNSTSPGCGGMASFKPLAAEFVPRIMIL